MKLTKLIFEDFKKNKLTKEQSRKIIGGDISRENADENSPIGRIVDPPGNIKPPGQT